jgi:hypothetical protein
MSPELLVMSAPPSAYRRLASGHRATLAGALKRPLLVAVILGTCVCIYAVQRVTLGLMLSAVLTWSFAVIVQLLAAAALVVSSKRRRVSLPAAMDLFFMGHAPWSLWLLAVAAWAAWLPHPVKMDYIVLATAAVPFAWTAVIVFAFCQEVLNDAPRVAVIRTIFHQSLIWTFTGVYIAVVVALWPRIIGTLAS